VADHDDSSDDDGDDESGDDGSGAVEHTREADSAPSPPHHKGRRSGRRGQEERSGRRPGGEVR
jgi:hypothetical protein